MYMVSVRNFLREFRDIGRHYINNQRIWAKEKEKSEKKTGT